MKRLAFLSLLVLAVAAPVAGCGGTAGGEGNGGGESYARLVRGLAAAARVQRPFDALHRPADLSAAQRASLTAFCAVTDELTTYGEAYKVEAPVYYISRIKTQAEDRLPAGSTPVVDAAVGRMSSLYGLSSFDRDAARRYVTACYH